MQHTISPAALPLAAQPVAQAAPPRRARAFLRRVPFRIWVCLLILVILVTSAVFADLLSQFPPNQNSLVNRMKPPIGFGGTARNLLGTDPLGRDILSRLLFGGQVSIAVAALATVIGLMIGVGLGVLAGYLRGWFDQIVMYLVDVQLSLPFLLLAIVASIALGTSTPVLIGLAALSTWPIYTRICRGIVLSLRERDFITAARAIGAGDLGIMWRHLLPNLVAPTLVLATLSIGRIILLESGLSFLGIGIKAPDPSWGNMIGEGRDYLQAAWWLAVVPGTALVLLTVAVGVIGDWLRDLTDVRIGA